MHLAALSAGAQAPRGHFNGAVHSVFRKACNVRLDDGRLLALLAPDLGNVPHGVRVDVPAGFAFADHFSLGRPVGCRAYVLRIAGGEISIDLGTAEAWRGEPPGAGVDPARPEVARALQAAWRTWRRVRPPLNERHAKLLIGAVRREGVRLARAARALQTDQAAAAVAGLIGRGPGLTPSGDDLTVGLLAGLWSTAHGDPARRAFLDALGAALTIAAAATGDISRAYLVHAARGHFAQPLIVLVHRMAEGADPRAVDAATHAALRVGHTSGADGVLGLLLGLAAWAPHSVLPLPRARSAIAGASLLEPKSPTLLAARSRPSRSIAGPCPARYRPSANAVEASAKC